MCSGVARCGHLACYYWLLQVQYARLNANESYEQRKNADTPPARTRKDKPKKKKPKEKPATNAKPKAKDTTGEIIRRVLSHQRLFYEDALEKAQHGYR